MGRWMRILAVALLFASGLPVRAAQPRNVLAQGSVIPAPLSSHSEAVPGQPAAVSMGKGQHPFVPGRVLVKFRAGNRLVPAASCLGL